MKTQFTQQALMKFAPDDCGARPYPSHAQQFRDYHGPTAWLFNPWTGKMRDPRDIGTDPHGLLISSN